MKTWNRYFLDMLPLIASRSKDPHTQMGAIIVGPKNEIRATGYNSFQEVLKMMFRNVWNVRKNIFG